MRVQLQPAWVLHTRPFRETSLLVEAFSRDHGRVGLIARGARRPKSRLRGELQPFRPLLLSYSGRGELPALTGAEVSAPSPDLHGQHLAAGFYLNELVLKLLPRNDPHPMLFDEYQDALGQLTSPALVCRLRLFEKRLLQDLGWGLMLDQDCHGAAIDAARTYGYDLERGPLPEGGGRLRVQGATLLAFCRDELGDGTQLREARALTRAALAAHLGSSVIRSRELLTRSTSGAG